MRKFSSLTAQRDKAAVEFPYSPIQPPHSVIMECEPRVISQRACFRNEDIPLGEQTIASVSPSTVPLPYHYLHFSSLYIYIEFLKLKLKILPELFIINSVLIISTLCSFLYYLINISIHFIVFFNSEKIYNF